AAAGQVICGGSLSVTVTVCWHELLLPPRSVTVHVTVVTPMGNCAGASLVTVPTPQLSVATGVPRATPEAKHWPASGLIVMLPGHVIDGNSPSTMVTLWVNVALLPCASVTVQITFVLPTKYTVGASLITLGPPQLSVTAVV